MKEAKIKLSLDGIELPQIGRYRFRKEWERACWHKIRKSGELLELLVTPYERHNLVLRAVAIERIQSGKKYRQIAEELWLSPQTVSTIKKAMLGNSYRSYRQRGKVERKKKVYSYNAAQKERRPSGKPVRTKYGTIYLRDL